MKALAYIILRERSQSPKTRYDSIYMNYAEYPEWQKQIGGCQELKGGEIESDCW